MYETKQTQSSETTDTKFKRVVVCKSSRRMEQERTHLRTEMADNILVLGLDGVVGSGVIL